MEHDAWFFIGVFVFIFVVWIATGGPLRSISFPRSTVTVTTPTATSTTSRASVTLPRAPYTIGTSRVSLGGSSGGGSYGGYEEGEPAPTTIEGVSLGPLSPYRTLVSLGSYVSNASSSNPRNEYVQLSVANNANASVSISGWKLVSEVTGKAAAIPRGTEIPTSGIINSVRDIVLAPGDQAIVISGRSPVGISFRENKCIGYLSTFQEFTPSLPQNCPVPSDELVSFYGAYYIRDADCIDYVHSLSRCETILFPPRKLSNACRSFVSRYLNYNGCVAAHKNDPDFGGSTWRIYLDLTKHLWRAQHEIVKLLDRSNKTVDAFSY